MINLPFSIQAQTTVTSEKQINISHRLGSNDMVNNNGVSGPPPR